MHASADKAIFILLDAAVTLGLTPDFDTGFHWGRAAQSQIPKHASTIGCTQKAA